MKIDKVTFADGTSDSCVNLTKSAGLNGVNLHDDVMIVQAMLRLIATYSRTTAGLGDPDYSIPEITGSIDGETRTRRLDSFSLNTNRNYFDGTTGSIRHITLAARSESRPVRS